MKMKIISALIWDPLCSKLSFECAPSHVMMVIWLVCLYVRIGHKTARCTISLYEIRYRITLLPGSETPVNVTPLDFK